jgi:hypothetical protein
MALPTFTPHQLNMELALLLRNLHINLCFLVGTERAGIAFGLEDLDRTPGDLLPEEFPVEDYPVHSAIHRLADFVNNQVGFSRSSFVLDTESINALLYLLTPELEKEWSEASAAFPGAHKTGIMPSDNVNEDFAVGIHYHGLIKKIVQLAEARHKVDDSCSLTLSEVAILIDFNERSVMSAANRGEFASEIRDGRRWVETDEALKWMIPRGYKPTVFKNEQNVSSTQHNSYDEMLFVPIAPDKTIFLPESKIGSNYVIGTKGNEQKFRDYYEALSVLSQMPTPFWMRAGTNGNWGQIRGVEWQRMPKKHLDYLLGNTRNQESGNV